MSVLSYVFENASWIAPPLFLLSLTLLFVFIRNVIVTVKQARLVSLPVAAMQEIDFTEKGRVVLCTEGPLLSTRFGGLTYELTLLGRPVESRPSLFRARTSGLSTARTEMRYFELPVRGRYVLSIEGLASNAAPDAEHRIVFMRPHLARAMVSVIGIVLASVCSIGTLVLFFLRLTLPETSG